MELLTPDEAQALTSPLHQIWVEAHLDSFSKWKKRLTDDPEFFAPLSKRTRHNALHDLVISAIAREIHGRSTVTEILQFFAVVFSGQALVRFKHLDEELKPRNYPTEQQRNIGNQEFTEGMIEHLAFEGIEAPMTVLTVGYTLTLAEDEIASVVVVCRNPELVYSYDLYRREGDEGLGGLDVSPLPGFTPKGPRIISSRKKGEATTGS
jgi:hypothetical protein